MTGFFRVSLQTKNTAPAKKDTPRWFGYLGHPPPKKKERQVSSGSPFDKTRRPRKKDTFGPSGQEKLTRPSAQPRAWRRGPGLGSDCARRAAGDALRLDPVAQLQPVDCAFLGPLFLGMDRNSSHFWCENGFPSKLKQPTKDAFFPMRLSELRQGRKPWK